MGKQKTRYLMVWLCATLLSGWGMGCLGLIGNEPDPPPPPGTRVQPPVQRPLADGALPPGPQDSGDPDTNGVDTPGVDQPGNPNGCPTPANQALPDKVYFADVQPFLNEYCVNCHSGGSSLPAMESYHHSSHAVAPKDFWALALAKLNKGEMPPQKPNACDDLERFGHGLRVYRKWAAQGFEEKPGGSTPTDFEQDPFYKFPTSATCKKREPLPSRLWRLTTEQLRYSLQDVFGTQVTLPDFTFTSNVKEGFSNNAGVSTINSIDLTSWVKALNLFSKELLAKHPDWKSCATATGNACATQLATQYGQMLWRRPLTTAEISSLTEQFNALVSSTDRATALESIAERLLLSPHFMYRSEIGDPVAGKEKEGLRKLSPYEVASFLSYLIWQSVPDDTLLTAAAKAELESTTQIQGQVARMIADPRSQRGTLEFFNDWLRLRGVLQADKDPKLFNYPVTTREAVLQASEKLINDVIWQRKGSLKELFTTNQVFANKVTAPLYGLTSTSTAFVKVTVPATERTGILTTPAFLAVHAGTSSTGFVHRGVFFRSDLACKPFSDPPDGVAESLKDKLKNIDTSQMTMREVMTQIHSVGTCNSCHKDIDPLGAAFENFDPIGQYRTTEKPAKLKIDASGEINDLGDIPPKFQNAVQLIKNLADSERFQQCFTLKLFTHAYGQRASAAQSCEIAKVYDALHGNQFSLAKSYEALLNIEQLLYRKEETTP